MAYIGYFDELVTTVMPQITAVLNASEALITSANFKKMLEIILAFGNYMNSAKRGPAYGFKLPTFERVRSLSFFKKKKKNLFLHGFDDFFLFHF